MINNGPKLNERVWKLFEKAGFDTNPNSVDSAEFVVSIGKGRPLDLMAVDSVLKVKIIASNKSGKAAGKGSWTAHMTDCEDLRKRCGADKCILIATDHELDSSDLRYAETIGLIVWTEETLRYFEEVAETIGHYAKYEIINSLKITTKEESSIHKLLALKVLQPTAGSETELYLFSMSPAHLLKTAVIYRRAQGHADAYQRMLKRTRLPKIGAFLDSANAILPTDIIVHLDDSIEVEELSLADIKPPRKKIEFSNQTNYTPVIMDIPLKYASMELIDGQHRLFGFVKADQLVRENFNLVIVGIKKLSEAQKRDTFVAINDNSRRMDPNLVSYLKYTDDDTLCQADPALMAIRIIVDINKQSPFKKKIKLLDVGTERLTLKGLSGYDLKGLVATRGLLRRFIPSNSPNDYVQALRVYFSVFQSEFKTEWSDPDTYILATNRGVTALLKLLKSILRNEGGIPDEKRVKEYALALKQYWKSWKTDDLKKSYVGSQGWKQFHLDLVEAIKKEKKFASFKE